jgi:hypothetical protein
MSNQGLYQPLDEARREIRLVEVLSADGDDKVKCRLRAVSLEDRPQFSALSYVWGDPQITEDIELNSQTFAVNANLAYALKFVKNHWQAQFPLRDKAQFRLWADGICINQQDSRERSHQVNIMHNIYSTAELVLSWLGCGVDEMGLALYALGIISKETSRDDSTKLDPYSWVSREPDMKWLEKYPSWCKDITEEYETSIWSAISTFIQDPYWKRVWIFQEVILGQSIVYLYGSFSLVHQDIVNAVEWLASVEISADSGRLERPSFVDIDVWLCLSAEYPLWKPIIHISMWRYEIRNQRDFREPKNWWRIFKPKRLQATDPRDHVYGLLGLASCGIPPDYGKDFKSVLNDLAETVLRGDRSLQWLETAGVGIHHETVDFSTPSWAPNFVPMSMDTRKSYFSGELANQGVFHPAPGPPRLINSVLHVSAFLGPSISLMHEEFTLESFRDGSFFSFITGVISRNTMVNRVHPLKVVLDVISSSKGHGVAAMFKISVGLLLPLLGEEKDWMPNSRALGVHYSHGFPLSNFDIFFPGITSDENLFWALFEDPEIRTEAVSLFCGEYITSTALYRFTELDHGHFGAAPRYTRPGDTIAILQDLGVPVVLRKRDNHYILIGTCFIPGLMEGEAKELVGSGMARMEEIQIR